MGCLDENALLDYAGGHLPEAARADVDAHVASCAACRELLAQWLNAGADEAAATEDPARTVPLTPGRARRGGPDTAPPSPSSLPPRGVLAQGTRVGRYVVLRPLGEGGMGVVYTAWDPELDRTVCLKLLRSELVALLGAEAQPRLQREAQAMARVEHPHVVGIHDVGRWDGGLFIAMEYVRGGPAGRGARVPGWLKAVVLRGLAGDPSRREATVPGSSKMPLGALQGLATHMVVICPPAPLATRPRARQVPRSLRFS